MNSKKLLTKKNETNSGNATVQALAITVIVGLAIFWASMLLGFNKPHLWLMHQQYILIEMIISSINTILLVYLLSNYLEVYSTVKTNFTIGLIILATGLLAHSITANPLFYMHLGYMPMSGPFMFVPSIFTFVAVLALTYMTRQ